MLQVHAGMMGASGLGGSVRPATGRTTARTDVLAETMDVMAAAGGSSRHSTAGILCTQPTLNTPYSHMRALATLRPSAFYHLNSHTLEVPDLKLQTINPECVTPKPKTPHPKPLSLNQTLDPRPWNLNCKP